LLRALQETQSEWAEFSLRLFKVGAYSAVPYRLYITGYYQEPVDVKGKKKVKGKVSL
jgi:hypothetical protein